MNDQVGYLHFFANFDSGNLDSASLVDPLTLSSGSSNGGGGNSSSSLLSPAESNGNRSRRFPGAPGKLLTLRDQEYFLSIASDCSGQGSFESAHNRSWFYFGVSFVGDQADGEAEGSSPGDGSSGTPADATSRRRPSIRHKATFTIVNLLATNLIFDHDNRPVYCNDTMTEWDRLPQSLQISYFDKQGNPVAPPTSSMLQQFHNELSGKSPNVVPSSSVNSSLSNVQEKKFQRGWHQCSQRVTWTYTFTALHETVYFAMCYPFSYHKQQQLIDDWLKKFGDDRGQSHLYVPAPFPSPPSESLDIGQIGQLRRTSSTSRATDVKGAMQRTRTPPPSSEMHAASAPVTPAKPPQFSLDSSQSKTPHRPTGGASSSNIPTPPPFPQNIIASPVPLPAPPTDRSEGIYLVRETLCFSVENRRVDLLTISGHNGKHPEGLREPSISNIHPVRTETPRPFLFPNKRFVLITCRVHPGETPASHVLHGLIEFLFSNKDPRSAVLRELFVFKIIPILNPDGVACGHYRTDTRGVNLNRMYDNPDPRFQPTIYAARELFFHLEATKKLVLYLDLHAHASKRGCFVFGNAWEDDATQVQALLYPKLLSMNSLHFDFPSCDFSSRSMTASNRVDGTTKGGTGRVALASTGSLVECYTLEASYCMGLSLNNVIPLELDKLHAQQSRILIAGGQSGADSANSATPLRRASSFDRRATTTGNASSSRYSPETYHELGRGLMVSLLDMVEANPLSRLAISPHHTLNGLRLSLEKQLRLLHVEQQRVDSSERHRSVLEHNKVMERLGLSRNLPVLNAYNNASQHKLIRDENGVVSTVKAVREQQNASSSTAPLRLLA